MYNLDFLQLKAKNVKLPLVCRISIFNFDFFQRWRLFTLGLTNGLNFKLKYFDQLVRVCIHGLILVETRQDRSGGNFPIGQDLDKSTYPRSHCSGNFETGKDKFVDLKDEIYLGFAVLYCNRMLTFTEEF